MKNFCILGVGGYIAPRHLEAILQCGGNLLACCDVNDSVGIVDRYFPDTKFFKTLEETETYLYSIKNESPLDFVSICTPNYLHLPHIHFAFRNGADAICEKPLGLGKADIELIEKLESDYQKSVFTILQLRLLPELIKIKSENENSLNFASINLKYITPRGQWYHQSWKSNAPKSGGLLMNIGIHFFDILMWIFGDYKSFQLGFKSATSLSGNLELEKANISWHLSIDKADLPSGHPTSAFRLLEIDGRAIDMSYKFQDLHIESYERILNGNGFRTTEASKAVKLVELIANEFK